MAKHSKIILWPNLSKKLNEIIITAELDGFEGITVNQCPTCIYTHFCYGTDYDNLYCWGNGIEYAEHISYIYSEYKYKFRDLYGQLDKIHRIRRMNRKVLKVGQVIDS